MCGFSFAGKGFCGLPYVAEWHYNDGDHPFTPAEGRERECGWVLQGRASEGLYCAGDDVDDAHTRPQPVNVLTTPLIMTMQYPKEEPRMNERQPEWPEGHVYPPSDDGGEPVTAALNAPTEHLELPIFSSSGPLKTKEAAGKAEWELAVQWIKMPAAPLLYGPWPLRKFILPDLPSHTRLSDFDRLEQTTDALETLERDYSLTVIRPEGEPFRVAWLTWDWAYGLTYETACDELAAMFG